MKKTILYAAMILALGFAAACDKTEEGFTGESLIRFAPETIGTKAMVDNAAALQAFTFNVYDLWSGQDALYVNDVITYSDNAWKYTSGNKYTWKKGTHKLFGFRSDGLATAPTLATDYKATFTHTFTTAADTQVDLLYSEIITITDTEWKSTEGNTKDTPIPLHFKHLATGLAMTLENYTAESVTVSAVSVTLPNAGSATVDFSGTEPNLVTGTLTSGTFTAGTLASTTLASKAKLDVLAQAALAADAKPAQYMVWPQTIAEGDAVVNVSYTQGGVNKNAQVKLPAGTWESGKIYSYNLEIRPTELFITFHVEDWQPVTLPTVDAQTGSINMSNVMWVNKAINLGTEEEPNIVNTVDNSGYGSVTLVYHSQTETVTNPDTGEETTETTNVYEPAVGFFTVNYPTNGTYRLSLIKAHGGDEKDLAHFTISPYGAEDLEPNEDGSYALPHDSLGNPQTIYFKVEAKPTDHARHIAQLDLHITPTGGVETSAYSEIRATYTLIIPATE